MSKKLPSKSESKKSETLKINSAPSKRFKIIAVVLVIVSTIGFSYVWKLTNDIADINRDSATLSSELDVASEYHLIFRNFDVQSSVFRVHRDVIASGPNKENSQKAGQVAQDNMIKAEMGALFHLAMAIDFEYAKSLEQRINGITVLSWDETNLLKKEIGEKVNEKITRLRNHLKLKKNELTVKIDIRDRYHVIFLVIQILGLVSGLASDILKPN